MSVFIELLSTSTQCDIDPVCVSMVLSIVNLQPDSTKCDFDPVCIPIELFLTEHNVNSVFVAVDLTPISFNPVH